MDKVLLKYAKHSPQQHPRGGGGVRGELASAILGNIQKKRFSWNKPRVTLLWMIRFYRIWSFAVRRFGPWFCVILLGISLLPEKYPCGKSPPPVGPPPLWKIPCPKKFPTWRILSPFSMKNSPYKQNWAVKEKEKKESWDIICKWKSLW